MRSTTTQTAHEEDVLFELFRLSSWIARAASSDDYHFFIVSGPVSASRQCLFWNFLIGLFAELDLS